ncbi:MAG: translation initiation factor IF-2 [Halobacteria archaeon]|nr:translation initiation factor IF-2 [Halobacteria archaeon]
MSSSGNQEYDEERGELRTPIISVLGHVDHGKTTLLDRIRGSAVAEDEAGAITQHIGSTVVPISVIKEICESLMSGDFEVPGLLFIDTPGHHAFTTLRSRGGALSDIAVLVVDVNDGFQPQTKEAINILDQYKTPFVLAANKIDTIPGWNPNEGASFNETYDKQPERVRRELDNRLYEIIGELNDEGFSGDRYDRVKNFQENIGIVPVSAKTGEGVPDLLTVLVGLSQRFLKENLKLHTEGPGTGTVVEVKEERGFGTTVDIILYDGVVEVGDRVVIGGKEEPIVTDVRALLKPRELSEIRVEKEFERVERVTAAAGIKVAAPNLDDAMAGAPFRVVSSDKDVDAVVNEVRKEMGEVEVETQEEGIVVKGDTLGSIEALGKTLSEEDIPIMKIDDGDVSKRDVVDAETAEEREHRAIIAFNVDVRDDAREYADNALVRIFEGDVIYRLIENYQEWVDGLRSERAEKILGSVVRPCKFRILPDHVFRQSNPAVVGVEILGGYLEKNIDVERDGDVVGTVKGIQKQGEDIDSAEDGERVSVAIDGPIVGRQIDEGDVLYSSIPEKHAKALESEFYEGLKNSERTVLDEYLDKKRQDDPFWAK